MKSERCLLTFYAIIVLGSAVARGWPSLRCLPGYLAGYAEMIEEENKIACRRMLHRDQDYCKLKCLYWITGIMEKDGYEMAPQKSMESMILATFFHGDEEGKQSAKNLSTRIVTECGPLKHKPGEPLCGEKSTPMYECLHKIMLQCGSN